MPGVKTPVTGAVTAVVPPPAFKLKNFGVRMLGGVDPGFADGFDYQRIAFPVADRATVSLPVERILARIAVHATSSHCCPRHSAGAKLKTEVQNPTKTRPNKALWGPPPLIQPSRRGSGRSR